MVIERRRHDGFCVSTEGKKDEQDVVSAPEEFAHAQRCCGTWKKRLQRLASELDHREESLQDCIFRGEMILALSEVPVSLKSRTGLWEVGGAGDEPRDTNTLKENTPRSVCAPEVQAQAFLGSIKSPQGGDIPFPVCLCLYSHLVCHFRQLTFPLWASVSSDHLFFPFECSAPRRVSGKCLLNE